VFPKAKLDVINKARAPPWKMHFDFDFDFVGPDGTIHSNYQNANQV